MCRKLKELEKKVKGGEKKEDMIVATGIDTETNTERLVIQACSIYLLYFLFFSNA